MTTNAEISGAVILYCDHNNSGTGGNLRKYSIGIDGDAYCFDEFDCYDNLGNNMGKHSTGLTKCDASSITYYADCESNRTPWTKTVDPPESTESSRHCFV